MAYLQHDGFDAIDGFSAATSGPEAVLTALERQVVAFAARDPLASLATTRRPIVQALFGVEPARALADPRLEALRRFVVLYRHGHGGTESSRQALIGTGFSRKLLDDVRGAIRVDRPPAASSLIPALMALIASYVCGSDVAKRSC